MKKHFFFNLLIGEMEDVNKRLNCNLPREQLLFGLGSDGECNCRQFSKWMHAMRLQRNDAFYVMDEQ